MPEHFAKLKLSPISARFVRAPVPVPRGTISVIVRPTITALFVSLTIVFRTPIATAMGRVQRRTSLVRAHLIGVEQDVRPRRVQTLYLDVIRPMERASPVETRRFALAMQIILALRVRSKS